MPYAVLSLIILQRAVSSFLFFFSQYSQVSVICWWKRGIFSLTNCFCLYSMNSNLWHLTTGMRTTPLLSFMSKMWMTIHPCLTGHCMRRRSQRKMTAACRKIFFRSLTLKDSLFFNLTSFPLLVSIFLAWCTAHSSLAQWTDCNH